jgi:hypothetical protein
MKSKTPWETAAESEGVTNSERYLTRLARKAFLSLWSYSNLYTDEGRSKDKGDGKELCDLVVVFGNNVLLFSDKHCKFPSHPDIKVSWSRWYRRAIEKSARQLLGAEKFIKAHPTRVFLDKDCQTRLPIDLPDPRIAHYFLVVVTRGSYEVAERFWGRGSSGSLMLDSTIEGNAHYETPFRIGFPLLGRRFVHILDEMTVDVLLEELDTVPDLIVYLECKEAYFCQPAVYVSAAGEEQLLARYMCTMKDGKHTLPAIPDGTSAVAIIEGDWEFYSVSAQRAAKKAADAPSYMWDQLIEYQSSFIRAGTATSLPGLTPTASDHERVVRALADESRLSRRQLAANFRHALAQSEPGKKFARVVISGDRRDRAYVFLTAPKPADATYEEYREMRNSALLTYCHGVKLKFPWLAEAVGIASEPLTESASSQNFLYVDLRGELFEAEEATMWREAMEELDVLQSPTVKADKGKYNEFPIPFNFPKGPEFYSVENGMPMNRAARRAMAKQARRKGGRRGRS